MLWLLLAKNMKHPVSILPVTKYLIVLFLLSFIMATSCVPQSAKNSKEIELLDSLLTELENLEKAKILKLDELTLKSQRVVSPTEKYLINKLLFEEYYTYQSDSAMKYINANLDIARNSGNKEWETGCKIDKAELLAATGLLSESVKLLSGIDSSTLGNEMLVDYYGKHIFLYSHMGNYTGGNVNDFYIKERAYKDSIMEVIPHHHPEYLWYKGWDVLGTEQSSDSIIEALKTKLQNSNFNTHQDAKDFYILAKLYQDKGDMNNATKYMAISAIADVKTVNSEIASLEDLAKIMFASGDIDRAYSYINYSLNKAINYPNRVKAYSISEIMDAINKAYQERNQKQQQRTRVFLILVCFLALILIVALSMNFIQNIKLKRQGRILYSTNRNLNEKLEELSQAQQQLNLANTQLIELNDNLRQKNEELNEANYVKEEYIGYVFTICSSYISKMESLKRNIYLKAVAKRYKGLEEETANLDMKDELKEFYKSFDSIFLHIYPNFVDDFNTLLQEDKRIYPKEGELLNTELRIYALVRLGITDSVKIAEFLHCSVQTVYNNRFKVRNKAIISKKDFAESVRTLGKYVDRTS